METLLFVELVGFTVLVVWAILHWAPRVVGSLIQSFSGEQGTLVPRGLFAQSTRIRRTIELQAVVSRLALITRLNLPLCPALEASATGERGRIKQVLRGLARRILEGAPVSAALAAAFPGCPSPLIAALRRAESHGQLARALDQEERMIGSMIDVHFSSTANTRHAIGYALVMMLFCVVMVFWVMVFLMPKFKEIFLDFDTRLPGITMALLNFADWFSIHFRGILIALGVFVLGSIGMLIRVRRRKGVRAITRIVALVRRSFPFTRTIDYGLGMSKVIRSMAQGVQSGASNAFADSPSTLLSPTNHLCPRLDMFSLSVAKGVAPHRAAQEAKLGDVFVCALRMVERGEDSERALAHAADYYEAIACRWWHALAAASGPLVTIAMGIMVGFVALALFTPLIALIDAVTGTI